MNPENVMRKKMYITDKFVNQITIDENHKNVV